MRGYRKLQMVSPGSHRVRLSVVTPAMMKEDDVSRGGAGTHYYSIFSSDLCKPHLGRSPWMWLRGEGRGSGPIDPLPLKPAIRRARYMYAHVHEVLIDVSVPPCELDRLLRRRGNRSRADVSTTNIELREFNGPSVRELDVWNSFPPSAGLIEPYTSYMYLLRLVAHGSGANCYDRHASISVSPTNR